MAWDGRVSCFHDCHELGSFDFDGFLLFKADDDTTNHCTGGTALCSSHYLCTSHGCHQTMRHPSNYSIMDALMAWTAEAFVL
jgi:hypothetical protein